MPFPQQRNQSVCAKEIDQVSMLLLLTSPDEAREVAVEEKALRRSSEGECNNSNSPRYTVPSLCHDATSSASQIDKHSSTVLLTADYEKAVPASQAAVKSSNSTNIT